MDSCRSVGAQHGHFSICFFLEEETGELSNAGLGGNTCHILKNSVGAWVASGLSLKSMSGKHFVGGFKCFGLRMRKESKVGEPGLVKPFLDNGDIHKSNATPLATLKASSFLRTQWKLISSGCWDGFDLGFSLNYGMCHEHLPGSRNSFEWGFSSIVCLFLQREHMRSHSSRTDIKKWGILDKKDLPGSGHLSGSLHRFHYPATSFARV